MGLFDKRTAFKPFEYPSVIAFKDAINHAYWLVSEWNFTSDIQDYQVKLQPFEREALKRAMLAISQVEVSVKKFWAKLGDRFPKAEFDQVGISFAESEVRHADAYSHLLKLLGLEGEFATVLDVPAIRGRVDYLSRSIAAGDLTDNKHYTSLLTFFSLFVENVSLFSQFAIVKSFNKHRAMFKDIDNVIQATQQEEAIHAQFGAHVVNLIRAEHPDWLNASFHDHVRRMVEAAYKAEAAIVDWIFEQGELPFLSAAAVKEFIKYRINESVQMIGGGAVFAIDHARLSELEWFTQELHADITTDFFHKRPVTYAKRAQAATKEDLF